MRINLLTNQKTWARGFNDFFPLLKWKKALLSRQIQIQFFYSQKDLGIFSCDQLWVDYRYFQSFFNTTNQNIVLDSVFDFLIEAKQKVGRLVLFDSSDGSGSQCLNLTEFVDLHLKKQVLKDRLAYTIDNGDRSLMCWIPEGSTPSNIKYYTTNADQIDKFRVAWNVGVLDYRYFPYSNLYPFGTSGFFPSQYNKIKSTKANSNRKILTSYRGTLHNDTRYSFQRKLILDSMSQYCSRYNVRTGSFIGKNEYLDEMRNSVFSFSPFGWGEVCFRDFEIILSGSIMVKPNMDHLDTYPNYYLTDETYLSLNWNMDNLDDVVEKIVSDTDMYFRLAEKAQEIFLEHQYSEQLFINHFKSIIE